MKTNPSTRISGLTIVFGMLTLASASILGGAPAAEADGRRGLEGTWFNEINVVTCAPAPFAVIATGQSLTTYMRGGTLIEGGAAPPAPFVSRSAGHGIWKRAGSHSFLLFFRFDSFDSLGRRVRVTEVTSRPRLIKGDNPETPDFVEPYYLSGNGTNKVTNLNPVDGSVINVFNGCNKATSRPILFED
jgi:hypothetical protein